MRELIFKLPKYEINAEVTTPLDGLIALWTHSWGY